MEDYTKVIEFLNSTTPNIEHALRFIDASQSSSLSDKFCKTCKVLTSGWRQIDGVMLIREEEGHDSDYRILINANTERSLRELLLTFPRNSVGMFFLTNDWIESRILDLFDGKKVNVGSEVRFVGTKKGSITEAEQKTLRKKKDEIANSLGKLTSIKGRSENSQFLIEGEMMVERAFSDGLPIEKILYTNDFVSSAAGKDFLKKVFAENLSIYLTRDSVIGSLTTTRPIPAIIAPVHQSYPTFLNEDGLMNFHFSQDCILLIIENVQNPDNLGMTLRTADAAGVSAVLISGEGANPFHKNCIRASRGAVGRIPIFYVPSSKPAIEKLKASGWHIIGATAKAEKELYTSSYKTPIAVVVGNENSGLTAETRNQCTELVSIPMATGQSSLNVGVAAGILLYELRRP
ncbi:RNA methyltransferase [Candidatus Poribacteria bacterium]|nr:RNA methyltransferase [Candidatus Poribacteria bacterium]